MKDEEIISHALGNGDDDDDEEDQEDSAVEDEPIEKASLSDVANVPSTC